MDAFVHVWFLSALIYIFTNFFVSQSYKIDPTYVPDVIVWRVILSCLKRLEFCPNGSHYRLLCFLWFSCFLQSMYSSIFSHPMKNRGRFSIVILPNKIDSRTIVYIMTILMTNSYSPSFICTFWLHIYLFQLSCFNDILCLSSFRVLRMFDLRSLVLMINALYSVYREGLQQKKWMCCTFW